MRMFLAYKNAVQNNYIKSKLLEFMQQHIRNKWLMLISLSIFIVGIFPCRASSECYINFYGFPLF